MGLTIFVSVLTSAATTTSLFFGLRSVAPEGASAQPSGEKGDVIEVPSIVGVSTEQAREILNAKRLILTLADEQDDPNVPAGSILSQTPLAGSVAKPSTEIRAIVSRGVTTPRVPEVAGLTYEAAAVKIKEARLIAGEQTFVSSDTVPKGAVVGTLPSARTSIASGTVVQVNVSGGTEVEVPKVTGVGLSKARKVIEGAGFAVGATRYDYNENYGGNVVLKQTPEAGAKAAPGSKIDLVLNESD